jgi:uncharacterized membrane protein
MGQFLVRVWNDDRGSGPLTGEWLFLFAILVLGLITGLVAMRQALLSELAETADSLMSLNQSYDPSGQSNCQSSTAFSSASDTTNSVSFGGVGVSTTMINQAPCD